MRPLPGKIVKKQAVIRRNEKGRIIVNTGLWLATLDNMSLPVLTNGKEWHGLPLKGNNSQELLLDTGKGLKQLPSNVLF